MAVRRELEVGLASAAQAAASESAAFCRALALATSAFFGWSGSISFAGRLDGLVARRALRERFGACSDCAALSCLASPSAVHAPLPLNFLPQRACARPAAPCFKDSPA
eukprot:232838-Pleurochrysis_carterae.AAC.8